MTREEAKQWLEAMKSSYALPIETYEAIDMAIEALSADVVPFDVQLQSTREVIDKFAEDRVKVVRCKDCRHAHFKDFDKYCPYMVGALKPNQFCSHGERADKVSCSKCMHRDTCEDAYQEHSQYCNGERAEFKESAEAYKKWTVEDIGKWQNEIGVEKRLEDYHGKPTLTKPHGRLIDADFLRARVIRSSSPNLPSRTKTTVQNMIDRAPTVEERPQGEWLEKYYDADDREPSHYVCSECRNVWNKAFIPFTWHFWPSCGASMVVRGDEK